MEREMRTGEERERRRKMKRGRRKYKDNLLECSRIRK